MAKLRNFIGRPILILLEFTLLVVLLLSLAIRTPQVQTYFAQTAVKFLSDEWGVKMRIDELAIVFIDRFALEGVYLEDENGKPLARLESIYCNLSGSALLSKEIEVQGLRLEEGDIRISKNQKGVFNFQFIADYFKSENEEPKETNLKLDRIDLSDVRFQYNDYRYAKKSFGVDYNHIKLSGLYLRGRDIEVEGKNVKGQITAMRFEERSGLSVKKFRALAELTEKQIHVHSVKIKTSRSDLDLRDLLIDYNNVDNFKHFVDSVDLNINLYPSSASMYDVSLFAPNLKGMNEMVQLAAKSKGKISAWELSEIDLELENSKLAGSLTLPDFRKLDSSEIKMNLTNLSADLSEIKNIKLPDGNSNNWMPQELLDLSYVKMKTLQTSGTLSDLEILLPEIITQQGTIHLNDEILLSKNNLDEYRIRPKNKRPNYIDIDSLNLGKLLKNKDLNKAHGKLYAEARFSSKSFDLDTISGLFDRLDYQKYSYRNIEIQEAHLVNKQLDFKVKSKDKNAELEASGRAFFKDGFTVESRALVNQLNLNPLGFAFDINQSLRSVLEVEIEGTNLYDLSGQVSLSDWVFTSGDHVFDFDFLDVDLNRGKESDKLVIRSDVVNVQAQGKITDRSTLDKVQNQLSTLFPALIPRAKSTPSNKITDKFKADIQLGETDSLMAIFAPGFTVKKGSKIHLELDGPAEQWAINSSILGWQYGDIYSTGFDLDHSLENEIAKVLVDINEIHLSDSMIIHDMRLLSSGIDGIVESELTWEPSNENNTLVRWTTKFPKKGEVDFFIHPSHITLKNKKWDITDEAEIDWSTDEFLVRDFILKRNEQQIALNGIVSSNSTDQIRLKVNRLELEDIVVFLPIDIALSGKVNGFATVQDPFTKLVYSGDMNVQNLFINEEEVGNVFVHSRWDDNDQAIVLEGDLNYLSTETFAFQGSYLPSESKNNLNFDFNFDQTNIAFANAFLDPQVVSKIDGFLTGEINLRGNFEEPELSGGLDLKQGQAFIGILGVPYFVDGKIKVDKDGFYLNNVPVQDEEGNTGSVVGSIYHSNFTGWNFDLAFNLVDDPTRRDISQKWKPAPVEKFLVMNTAYKEGEYYYGKAYVTGYADIYGYADNLEITTDLKTKKGTNIVFPLYGNSDLEDEDDFLEFVNHSNIDSIVERQLDLTGVTLDLNFDVRENANVKIIFNDKVGDEINAKGNGNINLRVNNIGDIELNGTYTLTDGIYNFAMGIVKQNFYIEPGGQITWTGDPYNANINLSAYHPVTTSFSNLSADQLGVEGATNQEVYCYLLLSETLMQPAIQFDIRAPRANDASRTLLSRIKSDQDELNKQFLTLLVTKNFAPLGSQGGGAGGVLDVLANNINAALSQLSSSYKLGVDFDANNLTGQTSMAVDVSKEFLDDRLIVTGSFGQTRGDNNATSNQNQYIGDVKLDYLLNESGTFRVSIFNESNQNSVLQDNNQGLFQQGVGLLYQKEFNEMFPDDKKDKKRKKRKRDKMIPVEEPWSEKRRP